MSTGADREAADQIRCREYWRSRHVCGSRRCQQIRFARCDCQKAAIQMRDHDLSRARHHKTDVKESVLTTTFGPEHSPVCERVSRTTSRAASSSSHSTLGL